MPLPHEHSCRLKDPDQFQSDSFRRVTRDHNGKEYSVIMGKLKGKSTMTEQAYRYKKDIWSSPEAKKHCDKHGGSFEPAKEGKSSQLKEGVMDIEILKETYPNLCQEIFDAGKKEGVKEKEKEVTAMSEEKIKALEDEIKMLKTQIATRDDQFKQATEDNKRLDKELTIIKTKARAEKEESEAGSIMDKALQESKISESLYGKVKSMIDYKDFRTEDGAFDSEAFTKIFESEVRDWEEKLPNTGLGIGLDEGKEDGKLEGSAFGDENKEILAAYK